MKPVVQRLLSEFQPQESTQSAEQLVSIHGSTVGFDVGAGVDVTVGADDGDGVGGRVGAGDGDGVGCNVWLLQASAPKPSATISASISA